MPTRGPLTEAPRVSPVLWLIRAEYNFEGEVPALNACEETGKTGSLQAARQTGRFSRGDDWTFAESHSKLLSWSVMRRPTA